MFNPDILTENAWILPVGIALLVLVYVWKLRGEGQRRAARFDGYRELAAQRGMEFESTDGKEGATTPFRFTDRSTNLSLRITPDSKRAKAGFFGRAELLLQSPVFPGGLAVYAHQEHEELSRAVAVLGGMFDNPLARGAIGKFLGSDIGDNLGDLQAFDAPDNLPLFILASVDPKNWFDAHAIAQAIEDGPRSERQNKRRLLITITARGMTLRATPVPIDPEGIAQFIDLGLRLQHGLAKA